MRSRISEPLSVARIATACGTSHRTLHRALRREYGLSPMALLRRERLAMARAALCWPTEATTVTQVALSWGFEHLGRFSRYYARQFGELPSDTLQRARARSSAIALPRAG
ncbi:MAG: helix-turn-helix transcriptional regulator [Vicinamibacterales bacterium]|nr:helix-turn-helix transcriptional regulator [Vicinamibacterales bacterium]